MKFIKDVTVDWSDLDVVSKVFAVIFIVLIVSAVLIGYPYVIISAINCLFGMNIAYSVYSWLSFIVLHYYLKYNVSISKE